MIALLSRSLFVCAPNQISNFMLIVSYHRLRCFCLNTKRVTKFNPSRESFYYPVVILNLSLEQRVNQFQRTR